MVRAFWAPSPESSDETASQVAALVKRFDFVAAVMTPPELLAAIPHDPFLDLYRHSYRADRIPRFPLFYFSDGTSPVAQSGVAVRLARGAMIDLDRAVHGSPYEYDRHVPLVFMGMGVSAGASAVPARTVDVAPTLARLAGIPFPAGLDGRSLLKI
jgi:hypothetical protein